MKRRRHRPCPGRYRRPRDDRVMRMPDVYLYNVDDLQQIADDYLQQRKEEVAACERIIREKVEKLLASRDNDPGGAELSSLRV
ncbi:MAG: hypothetical protein U1F98_06070 [Verrucomicrobiota bacterium]